MKLMKLNDTISDLSPNTRRRFFISLCVTEAIVLSMFIACIILLVRYVGGETGLMRRILFTGSCVLVIALIYLVQWLFRIRFPLFVELMLIVFCFLCIGCSTVFNFYTLIPHWDKVTHTLSGMVFSTCGLLIANALVGKDLVGNRRIAVCVVIAFLFSLAVGYLWEIYEFTLDSLTGSSLQCWQNGVLQQFGNGTYLVSDAQGTGLKDTLGDMIVNLIGTVVFLVPATVVFLKKENTLRLFAWQRLHRRRRH